MSWMNVDDMVGGDSGYVCGRATWQPKLRIAPEDDWLMDNLAASDDVEWDDDAPRNL